MFDMIKLIKDGRDIFGRFESIQKLREDDPQQNATNDKNIQNQWWYCGWKRSTFGFSLGYLHPPVSNMENEQNHLCTLRCHQTWFAGNPPQKSSKKYAFVSYKPPLSWVQGFPSHVWWHRSLAHHCYSKPDPHRGKNKSGYPKKCGENILKLHGSRWLCPQNPSSVSVIAFYRCC